MEADEQVVAVRAAHVQLAGAATLQDGMVERRRMLRAAQVVGGCRSSARRRWCGDDGG